MIKPKEIWINPNDFNSFRDGKEVFCFIGRGPFRSRDLLLDCEVDDVDISINMESSNEGCNIVKRVKV